MPRFAPLRSNRSRPASALPLLALALLLAGCAGGGEPRASAASLDATLPREPEAALAVLQDRVRQVPEDLRARQLRAELLERVGDPETAAQEWQEIVVAATSPAHRRIARRGLARCLEAVLGPLHVLPPTDPGARARAGVLLNSWRALGPSDGWEARIGEARTLHRLGRSEEAAQLLAERARHSDPLSLERLLLLIFEEPGATDWRPVVRAYDAFTRAPEDSTREHAFEQLIRIAGAGPESESAHTAEGFLVRSARETTDPGTALARWARTHERERSVRILDSQLTGAVDAARTALEEGRPLEAWRELAPLLTEAPARGSEVASLLERCCLDLCALCQRLHDDGAAEEAARVARAIRSLPGSALPPPARERVAAALRREQLAAVESGIREGIAAAERERAGQQPAKALARLDALLEGAPAELAPRVQRARAHALADLGEERAALRTLQRHGPFPDPRTRRLQGILLARVGRGEEAEAILQSLPRAELNTEAFDALLVALEGQGKWTQVLARLHTLGDPTPFRHQGLRERATLAAARQALHQREPAEALRLLHFHLKPEELGSAAALPLLVEAELGEGRPAAAASWLLRDARPRPPLPGDLWRELIERSRGVVPVEIRFALLRRAPETTLTAEDRTWMVGLWPRLGPYLPASGRYDGVLLRSDGEGGKEGELRLRETWTGVTGRTVLADGGEILWRREAGRWIRAENGVEWWLPLGDGAEGRTEEEVSPDGTTARILASGHTVRLDGVDIPGCLTIEVSPAGADGTTVLLELAPERGVVRRSRVEPGGERTEEWRVPTLEPRQP